MENIINKFTDFITSKETKKVDKFYYISLIVITLLFIDYSLNISYKYQISSKLSTLEQIKDAETKFENDTEFVKELAGMKKELMREKHYYDLLFTRAKSNDSSSNFIICKESNQYNKIIFFISTTLFLYPIALISFIMIFFEIKSAKFSLFFKWCCLSTIVSFAMLINYLVLSRFPLLLDNIIFNYAINLVISMVIAQAIGRFITILMGLKNDTIKT